MGDFSPLFIRRHDDGTREVLSAGHMILISNELLAHPDLDPDFVQPDGTLHLDTAGQYRYQKLYPYGRDAMVYTRISPETD